MLCSTVLKPRIHLYSTGHKVYLCRSLSSSSSLARQFMSPSSALTQSLSSKLATFRLSHPPHLKVIFVRITAPHRILTSLFSTKSSANGGNNAQPAESVRKSVWKSSSTVEADSQSSQLSYRDELYRQLNKDIDIGRLVTQEMVLYDLSEKFLYRGIFVLVIFQFVFWAFCANTLYMFYSGVDDKGNKLRDLYKGENDTKGEDAKFWKTWLNNIRVKGYRTLVQGFLILIGTFFAVVMMFLMTRVVSSIRLMPGAKQVKISRLSMFGGKNVDSYKIFPLSDLSSIEHRLQRVKYLSLRVRGNTFNYLIDCNGTFSNEKIYDQTIGMRRKF